VALWNQVFLGFFRVFRHLRTRFGGPTGLKDIEEVVLVLLAVLILLVVILFILLSMTNYRLI
jgi:hypothetical protein